MQEFDRAFLVTMGHEGGYVNDKDDAGGETYRGISRRFHPSWPGWQYIDQAKGMDNFPAVLKISKDLQADVLNFYRAQFWDRFNGDAVAEVAPSLANELFDTAVNMGVHRAVIFLQQALNVLNRNQQIYADLVPDGKFGTNTMKALQAYIGNDEPKLLLVVMNALQANHYLEYMGKDPVQEKYARGWFKRVTL